MQPGACWPPSSKGMRVCVSERPQTRNRGLRELVRNAAVRSRILRLWVCQSEAGLPLGACQLANCVGAHRLTSQKTTRGVHYPFKLEITFCVRGVLTGSLGAVSSDSERKRAQLRASPHTSHCQPQSAALLGRFHRGQHRAPQDRIDPGLVALPLCLKPIQHIGIDTRRYLALAGGDRNDPAWHSSTVHRSFRGYRLYRYRCRDELAAPSDSPAALSSTSAACPKCS